MKIYSNKFTNYFNVNFAQRKKHKKGNLPEIQTPEWTSENHLAQISRAQVLMQNPLKLEQKSQTEENIVEILEKIAKNHGMELAFFINSNLAVKIGRPFEKFKNLHKDDACARCKKDENGNVKEIYFVYNYGHDTWVYDEKGEVKKYFDHDDMEALHEYKYTPDSFHNYLRYGKKSYIPSQEELEMFIDLIDGIYEDDSRVWRTEKPMVVYRALQDRLTDEQRENLSKIGGIFKDSSYVSTTQMIDTAKRFHNKNQILEIELPENSKYIDLDTLFNIEAKSWREQEFLLKRNSEFLVTGFDEKNNIIKVKYLNKD